MRRYVLILALTCSLAPLDVAVLAAQPGASAESSTRTLYLGLIRQARMDGKARAALAYLDDFDRQYPKDREAQVLRVNCLLDLGQIQPAKAAVALIPDSDRSGEALAVRGHVLAAQELWSAAATAYAAAQAASPADPYIGNAHGYAQLRAGQTTQAVETLKRALDLAPDAAHGETLVRNNLALALMAAGRIQEANMLIGRVKDDAERTRLGKQLSTEAARLASLEGGVVPKSQ
jgi:tetratricopeptide (TPR) repeat protein